MFRCTVNKYALHPEKLFRRFSNQLSKNQNVQQMDFSSDILPDTADVVIIGGGGAGCNTLYQLAKRGVRVVLLERAKLTAGSTWHNTGIVWTLQSNDTQIQLLNATRNIIMGLEKETGVNPKWVNNGGIYVARTQERLEEYKRMVTIAKSFGIPASIITPAEVESIFPLIDSKTVCGALYSPNDGAADPSAVCDALTSGAKNSGAQVIENCPVLKIVTGENSITGTRQVEAVETELGIIKTSCVVNCSGAWSDEVAKLAGLSLPLTILKHAYVVSESMPGVVGLPNVRDMDSSIYIRINGDSMFVGGFEKNPVLLDKMPEKFAFDLFELDWSMFSGHMTNATELIPSFGTAGVKSSVCGPHCFTPDEMPLVGEDPRLHGMFHNCGFNSAGVMLGGGCGEQISQWIVNGRPSIHMYSCDVRRFTQEQMENKQWCKERGHESYVRKYSIKYPHNEFFAGRNLKTDPFHQELLKTGAVFEEMQAYERPGWFLPQGTAPIPPYDWYGAYGTKRSTDKRYENLIKGEHSFRFSKHHHVIGGECLACRENVALFDMSYFSKLYLCGPDTQKAADWLFTADTNGPVNQTVYSCLLNKQGGVEADLLVSAINTGSGTQANPIFKGRGMYIVAGGAIASQTRAHINSVIREKSFRVSITDLSHAIGLLSVQGPKSRDLLKNLVDCDLSNELFPLSTTRMVKLAGHSVRAIRTTFVGELGWELHIPEVSCIPVYKAIWAEGAKLGLRLAGFRALYSLIAEKGYRLWNKDLRMSDNPLEANLKHTLRRDGEYLGQAAVNKVKQEGIKKQYAYFKLKENVPLWGLECIWRDGQPVGYLRRGEFAYALGTSVGQGYVRNPDGSPVTKDFVKNGKYQIEVMGELYDADVHLQTPFDPESRRVHGYYEEECNNNEIHMESRI
ncbi:sarcosine dehydrogenase [Lycorma delicatula]|uniref:sarcosine dehydrogenase n=1 Tax=Lycorma delicatula TaxID=130591 RepID=UPI003F50E5D8